MDAERTVLDYHDALRDAEPLSPYFAEDEGTVKYGVSETLVGYDAVSDGLRRQTRRTEDWKVESRALRVTERDAYAWFTDSVGMAWTDTDRDRRYGFDSRWSGTLERRDDWVFVGMHVSVPGDL